MTHEEHHRALVKRFSSELTPARRMWPVQARLAFWLAVQAAILTWVLPHGRADFMSKIAAPWYAVEIGVFAVTAILSAWLALRTAIPGRAVRGPEMIAALVLLAIGTALVSIGGPAEFGWRLGDFFRTGLPCALATCALAVLPWVGLWWAVKRGAPMHGGASGMWVGAGAMFFAFALMRIACPIDDPLHLLTWHLLPVFVSIGASALAGSVWLSFRIRSVPRGLRP